MADSRPLGHGGGCRPWGDSGVSRLVVAISSYCVTVGAQHEDSGTPVPPLLVPGFMLAVPRRPQGHLTAWAPLGLTVTPRSTTAPHLKRGHFLGRVHGLKLNRAGSKQRAWRNVRLRGRGGQGACRGRRAARARAPGPGDPRRGRRTSPTGVHTVRGPGADELSRGAPGARPLGLPVAP